MAAAAGEPEAGTRFKGVMTDGSESRYFLQSADDLKTFQGDVSTKKPQYVPGVMKISGWTKREDAVAEGALDGLDWTKHRVVVAVGGKVSSAEEKDGKLVVSVEAATEGHDRQYEALVVASAAAECEWEGDTGGFGGMVMSRPMESGPMAMPADFMQRPQEERIAFDPSELGGM